MKSLHIYKSASLSPRSGANISHLMLDYDIADFIKTPDRIHLREDGSVNFFLQQLHGMDNVLKLVDVRFGDCAIIPLYIIKTNVFCLSTTPHPECPGAAPSGLIVVPYRRVRDLLGRSFVTDYVKQEAHNLLQKEINELQSYFYEDVFTLVLNQGESDQSHQDGFYGANIFTNGMLSVIPEPFHYAARLMMSSFLAQSHRKTTVDDLIACGFVSKTYKGQEGTFVTKKLLVNQMPAANDRLVNGITVHGDMVATVELCPDNTIQLYIPDAYDYVEKADFSTNEGQSLARDAFGGDAVPYGVNEWKDAHPVRMVV